MARERKHWLYNFTLVLKGLDCWDYQMMYHVWSNDGITIVPWKNMVSNIGFGTDATHTLVANSPQAKMQQFELDKIIHPDKIAVNLKADQLERYSIIISSPLRYLKEKISSKVMGAKNRLIKTTTQP